jgi:hypothetical protein
MMEKLKKPHEWISVKDRLPYEDEFCWIFDGKYDGHYLYSGYFRPRYQRFIDGSFKIAPCWEIDVEYSNFKYLDEITHWMPYFTPDPPPKEIPDS